MQGGVQVLTCLAIKPLRLTWFPLPGKLNGVDLWEEELDLETPVPFSRNKWENSGPWNASLFQKPQDEIV